MFKKNLILFVLLFIGIASNSQTMHVFVFANTNDPKIGETCKVDKEQMLVNIKTVARVLNYEISIKTFDGDNFTAANIRNELNNFSCNKNDIVFFYYTGHGGRSRDDETKWPQLNFNKPNQNVDEYYIPLIAVNNTIDQNNPRLSIVLADCCNSYANITPKVEMKGSTTVSDDDKKDNVYQNLFHKVKGNIIISSSKIGEASYSDNEKGGWFTANYLDAMAKSINGEIGNEWSSLLDYTKKKTTEETQNNSSCPNVQTPQYELNIESSVIPDPMPSNDYITEINSLLDKKLSSSTKKIKINNIINNYFAKNAKVYIVAKNAKTIIDKEEIKLFLYRLLFSNKILDVVELNNVKNENNKIKVLRVHEIRLK